MAEKTFYGSDGQFKGSMDDNGRIYDANHGFIGYVKDGRIFDNCNLPHGHITDSGMVVDNCSCGASGSVPHLFQMRKPCMTSA